MSKPLQNQVIVITGASSGIGLALANTMAHAGAKLVLNARSTGKLEVLKSDLEAKIGAEILLCPGSVTEAPVVEAMMDTAVKHFGRLDVLLNNAGICPEFKLLQEWDIPTIDATIDTNLKGAIYAMKYAIPHMVHQGGGTIINLNSIAGKVAYPFSSVYCATKFGLTAMTESIAQEQQSNRIKIVGLYPGAVDTPLWECAEPGITQDPEKMLTAETIAQAVLYTLTQPANCYIKDITVLPLNSSPH